MKRKTPPHLASVAAGIDAVQASAPDHPLATPLDSWAVPILGAMVFAYTATLISVCIQKYQFHLYRDLDLALFTQALDGLLHGRLDTSLRGMSWLGDHSSLVLVLLVPLFAVFRHPVTLLVIQAGASALGAVPVFRLARLEGLGAATGLAFAAAYLLHPALSYAALYEFHPETIATPALIAAFYFLRANRVRPLILFATLALLCKEDVALVVLMLALYAWAVLRQPRAALALVGIAAGSLIVSFGVLKPWLATGAADYGRMYSHWGKTAPQVVAGLLLHPVQALAAFVATPGDAGDTVLKQRYYLDLLLPVAFLSLASPGVLLLALPVVAEHMLSWRYQQHAVVFQYTALVLPFVIAASVLGARNLIRRASPAALARATRGGREARRPEDSSGSRPPVRAVAAGTAARRLEVVIAAGCVAAACLAQALYGPWRGERAWLPVRASEAFAPSGYDRALARQIETMLRRVPARAGVVGGFEVLPQLATRRELHPLHHTLTGRYTFSTRQYSIPADIDAVLADLSEEHVLAYAGPAASERLRRLLAMNRLHPTAVAGDLVLFSADHDSVDLCTPGRFVAAAPARVVFDDRLAYFGCDPVAARAAPGDVVEFRTYWRRVAPIDRVYLLEVNLVADSDGRRYQRLRELGYVVHAPLSWPADSTMRETGRLILPTDLEPGRYHLNIRLIWHGPGGRGNAIPDDVTRGGGLALGTVDVSPLK